MQSLEGAYLQHIKLHLESNDPDNRCLRTYVDSWYAHRVGPPLANEQSGKPEWLNKGDLAKILRKHPLMGENLHAVSIEADRRIAAGEFSDLAKDHAVPMKQLVNELRGLKAVSCAEILEVLNGRYCVAIITQSEHKELGTMHDLRNPFCRYDCVERGFKYRLTERGKRLLSV